MAILKRFRSDSKQPKSRSVLDIPLYEYDPSSGLPRSISIGNRETEPLVSLDELHNHLIFLEALYEYRFSSPDTYPDRTRAAARKYAYWAQHTLPQRSRNGAVRVLSGSELPGLDVLMCWHAHMLNPKTYDQDTMGVYRSLQGFDFPLGLIARAIEKQILPSFQEIDQDDTKQLAVTLWIPDDIANAAQRQSKFIVNMHNIGWLDKDGWDQRGSMELQMGIVFYHAWLDLAHSTLLQYFLVPRLDIDLAWHSHQLHGARYKSDTERLLGQFLGHDDTAGDGKLGDGLKKTGELWKARFGYDYQPAAA